MSIAVRDEMLKSPMAEAWAQSLECPEEFLARSMEDMIGKDFEQGLANFNSVAQPESVKAQEGNAVVAETS